MPELPYVKIYNFLPHAKRKGRTVCIAYGQGHYRPWQVTYAGNGHYWRTLEGALGYCTGRGFLVESEVEDTSQKINDLFSSLRLYGIADEEQQLVDDCLN